MENYRLENQVIFCDYTGTDEILHIPEGVTRIGINHTDPTAVKEIYIPEGVIETDAYTFWCFPKMEKLHLPKSLQYFHPNHGIDTTNLTEITISDENDLYKVVNNCLIGKVNDELLLACRDSVLPNDGSIHVIRSGAFAGNSKLTGIYIPKDVYSIGRSLLWGCDGVTELTVDPQNRTYHSQGNCIINTKHKTLTLGCKTSCIPGDGSVLHIDEGAFAGIMSLTEITIPEGVQSIYRHAFRGCTNLKKAILPQSLLGIESEAFIGCDRLSIFYQGTMQQWAQVYKGRCWARCYCESKDKHLYGCPVYCTDGCILPAE